MDPQQLPVESGQRDEDTPAWTSQPPIEPPSEHSQIGTLHLHQPTGLDLPTCSPSLAQDVPHATLWEYLELYQQPTRSLEHNDIQNPQLSDQAQTNLHVEGVQYSKVCKRFMGASQRLHLLPGQGQMTESYNSNNNTSSHLCPVTDMTMAGYNGSYDISNAYMAPYETLQRNMYSNDGSNSHSFDTNVWPTQRTRQSGFVPPPFEFHTQESCILGFASPYLQSNEPSDSYETVHFQQPDVDPMPLEPLPNNDPVSFLDDYGQELPTSYFGAAAHTESARLPFLQNDGSLIPVDAYTPSTAYDLASSCNMMNPLTASISPQDFDQGDNHTTSMIRSDFSDFSSLSTYQAKALDTSTQRPLVPHPLRKETAVSKTGRKRTRCADQDMLAPHEIATEIPQTGGLENMHVYENPDTERAYNQSRAKVRKVIDKPGQACYLCWQTKRKCTRSPSGPCLQCRKLLQRHAHLTAVQKFTCTVRTKFSEIMQPLFQLQPIAGIHSVHLPSTVQGVLELLEPVRNILDIIEPQHLRQVWPNRYNVLTLLSYGFSIVRWRRAILCLKPSLEHQLNDLEHIHRGLLQALVVDLDNRDCYRCKGYAGFQLTIMLEAVCSMESSMIGEAAKEHFKSALIDRLLYVLCVLLPTNSTIGKLQREKVQQCVELFSTFPSTAGLLPQEYRDKSSGRCQRLILSTHRNSVGSQWGSSMDKAYVNDQKSLRLSEGPFPVLLAYVPARFLAAFGLDAETICGIGQDVNDPNHGFIKGAEECLEDKLQKSPLLKEFLLSSPVALSIGAKIACEALATTAYSGAHKVRLLCSIIVLSAYTCEKFAYCMKEELDAGKGLWFRKPFLGVSTTMYTWAEETDWIQHAVHTNAKSLHTLLLDEEPGPSGNTTTTEP